MKTSHLIVLISSAALAAGLFFILSISGASLVQSVAGDSAAPAASSSGVGLLNSQLPYFDLPMLTGDHIRSTDFTDIPLVIVFWSTWNAEAADQMHILDQYLSAEESASPLVKVIAIDSQEDTSIVSSFMNRGGYQVETLLDTQGRAGEAYKLKSLPTFYFVDRTGAIRDIHSGMLNQSVLMNKIEDIVR